MAKIVLVSLYDTVALGVRYLSATLKNAGHDVTVVYLKQYENLMEEDFPTEETLEEVNIGLTSRGHISYGYARPITQQEWTLFLDLVREKQADFVGVSLTSKYLNTAKAVTQRVRDELGLKVIWGGIEPTVNPEHDIEFADYLCVGEGEGPVLDFVSAWESGGDLTTIPNIWARENGTIHRNSLRPLMQDLDQLPFPDFGPEGKYEISDNGLWPRKDRDCWDDFLISTSRGCPYKCSFCIHNVLHEVYKGQKYVRRHSIEYSLAILKEARDKYGVKRIHFWDDIFSIHKRWLKEFLPRYRDEIGLPYWAYVYPQQCDVDIVELLASAGEVELRMGVQSGSERVLFEDYGRKAPREMVIEACRRMTNAGIDYSLDIITNNPFETEEDMKATLDLLLDVPQPVKIGSDTLSYLSFFPNYEITNRYTAMKDKTPKVPKNVQEFYNRLFLLAQYRSAGMIRRLERSSYFRKHPEQLQYFFPGQAPAAVRFLQRTIPKSFRSRAKQWVATTLSRSTKA